MNSILPVHRFLLLLISKLTISTHALYLFVFPISIPGYITLLHAIINQFYPFLTMLTFLFVLWICTKIRFHPATNGACQLIGQNIRSILNGFYTAQLWRFHNKKERKNQNVNCVQVKCRMKDGNAREKTQIYGFSKSLHLT